MHSILWTIYLWYNHFMKNIKKSQRQKRVEELIREIASNLIARESNRTSLITVTRINISPDLKKCDIYVSVFPENAQESALNFLKRKRKELRSEVKSKANLRNIPFFDFNIDWGEKNRQAIENIITHDNIK